MGVQREFYYSADDWGDEHSTPSLIQHPTQQRNSCCLLLFGIGNWGLRRAEMGWLRENELSNSYHNYNWAEK